MLLYCFVVSVHVLSGPSDAILFGWQALRIPVPVRTNVELPESTRTGMNRFGMTFFGVGVKSQAGSGMNSYLDYETPAGMKKAALLN